MNLLKNFVKGSVLTIATLMAIATSAPAVTAAIPYTGDSTPPAPAPAFNVYTGVPSEGNEADFFRGKVEGDTNASVNDVRSTCETGKRFTLRVYVHNGASQYENGNGNGPSVAKNSKVIVDLKNATASSAFNPNATISASNAASVNDGMTIACTDGKTVKLNYVAGTAKQYTRAGSKALSDSIVTTGAAIGTDAPNGDVWGCWEQRVYVTLTVEVKEQPKPVISTAACKLDEGAFVVTDDRKVTVKVNGVTENATVVGYEINWGDGSEVSTKQTDTHQYPTDKDGTYTIQARVQVKLADGTVKWVNGEDCAKTVVFKDNQPPVVPPTPPSVVVPPSGTLPDTGANVFGIFATVSMIGAFLHKAYKARKLSV